MRARSPRRAREMTARRALVEALLTERPVCEARLPVCTGRSVDVHERLSRARGGNILDPVQAHMVTVCRSCHEWIDAHPADAERMRLLLPSWHRCPPDGIGPC